MAVDIVVLYIYYSQINRKILSYQAIIQSYIFLLLIV